MVFSSENLGVYIHIPFCLRKCGYCDFYSVVNAPERNFIDCLLQEIDDCPVDSCLRRNDKTSPSSIAPTTLFFGGGTPTLLPVTHYREILQKFNLERLEEFTIECNPDTVSLQYLEQLQELGLTRVSIGMQSACSSILEVLDRTHNPDNVKTVIDWAKGLGLDTSLDLIYGAPGETVADWTCSVETAIGLQPDHISCYALTLEPTVPLFSKVNEIDEDEQAEKYYIADQLLEQAGYEFYEISNWSKPGKECKHNLGYWNRNNYYGFGPSAHSCIDNVRWANTKGIPWKIDFKEILTPREIELEQKMLKMRLKGGVAREQRMIIDSLLLNSE
jgi:oxygen-independent coproporphyrinogen-3 oxidase